MTAVDDLFEINRQIIQILKDDPLDFIRKRLDQWIVREYENKITVFLSKLSYLRENSTHEKYQAPSGVGKTYLILGILEGFPPEDIIKVSRVTPAWLDRMETQLKHKILLVQQLRGAETSQDSIHVMLSEGVLTLGTVRRGEHGEWIPHEVHTEGPISFAGTTASLNVDNQLETRTFSIYPDESEEQTVAIQKQQQMFDECPWMKEEAQKKVREIRTIIRWLRDNGVQNVIIPFSSLISLPTSRTRIRRDRPKLMELIKSLAILRQFNRPILEREGVKYVVALWKDAKDVMKYCGNVLRETIEELSAKENRILDICKKLPDEFNAEMVSAYTSIAQPTARRYLNRLRNKGYANIRKEGGGRGNTSLYSLSPYSIKAHAKTFLTDFNGITEQDVETVIRKWVTENRETVLRYVYDEEGKLIKRAS